MPLCGWDAAWFLPAICLSRVLRVQILAKGKPRRDSMNKTCGLEAGVQFSKPTPFRNQVPKGNFSRHVLGSAQISKKINPIATSAMSASLPDWMAKQESKRFPNQGTEHMVFPKSKVQELRQGMNSSNLPIGV